MNNNRSRNVRHNPKAKTDALENAPPVNMSKIDPIPLLV
jgi:hypothetical protein